MKTKLYVKGFISKKGKPCTCLVADLGYRKAILSFDINLCAEMLGVSLKELHSHSYDEGFTYEI